MEALKLELAKAEKQLKGAESMGSQKFIDIATAKINKLKAELEAEENKPSDEPKKAKKKANPYDYIAKDSKDFRYSEESKNSIIEAIKSGKTPKYKIGDLLAPKTKFEHKIVRVAFYDKNTGFNYVTNNEGDNDFEGGQDVKTIDGINDIIEDAKTEKANSKPSKKVINVEKALEQGEKSGLEKGFKFDDNGEAHAKYKSVVKKVTDENYIVLYEGDTKKDAELHLKDGEWKITCCELKEHPKFTTNELKKAVEFILDFKDCMYHRLNKVQVAKAKAKVRAKYEAKPDTTKVVDAVDKAAESVENRVDEIIEDGKAVTPKQAAEISVDVTKIVSAIEDGIKDKTEKKKFITNLIKKLQSKLKSIK